MTTVARQPDWRTDLRYVTEGHVPEHKCRDALGAHGWYVRIVPDAARAAVGAGQARNVTSA